MAKYKPTALPGGPATADRYSRGYHGTTHDLIGTHLDPEIGRDRKNYSISSDRHVNYTWPNMPHAPVVMEHPEGYAVMDPVDESERAAWRWSTESGAGQGRARVYSGQGEGQIGGDINMSVDLTAVTQRGQHTSNPAIPMAASRFRVDDTVWTPPPSKRTMLGSTGIYEQQALPVQGTIPNINWNQFGAPNSILHGHEHMEEFPSTVGWTVQDRDAYGRGLGLANQAALKAEDAHHAERAPYQAEALKSSQLEMFVNREVPR